jgi:hypothetical protein
MILVVADMILLLVAIIAVIIAAIKDNGLGGRTPTTLTETFLFGWRLRLTLTLRLTLRLRWRGTCTTTLGACGTSRGLRTGLSTRLCPPALGWFQRASHGPHALQQGWWRVVRRRLRCHISVVELMK